MFLKILSPICRDRAAVLTAVKRWLLAMLAPKRALRVAPVPPQRRGAFDLRSARRPANGQVGTKKRLRLPSVEQRSGLGRKRVEPEMKHRAGGTERHAGSVLRGWGLHP
jgi:hypothetical protein